MFEIKNLIPRDYQKNILKTAIKNNALVVLPTGMGKTAVAIMLAINRLEEYPNSKALIMAPSKPLCEQHVQTFLDNTTIPTEKISLLTGQINPKIRKELFQSSIIIIATPQTIQFDLEKDRISLEDVTLLVVDECHRSREKFANTIVARFYLEQAKNQRILALTASPGATKERINEIKQNLNLNRVEIRTEKDSDVLPYVQEKEIQWINVELSEEFNDLKKLISLSYKEKLKRIKDLGFSKPLGLINKKDLLLLQKRFQDEIRQGKKTAFYSVSLVAQAIKLEHALTLLETQGVKALKEYFDKLKQDESRAAKNILKEEHIIKAVSFNDKLVEKNLIHPKQEKLKEIIIKELRENPSSKLMVFANYRFTVNELVSFLKQVEGAKPGRLVGQKDGLTQKQQIQIVKDFEENIYNILICTSIGEEGLHLSSADLAIFYEPIPSEIRSIQRKGRVGRVKIGRIIFLITKGTKDEAFYWSSFHKEKKMRKILYDMKKESNNLKDFL